METQALAVPEEQKPMSLYASTEPASVVDRATSVAKSLVPIIDQQKLFVDIQGRKYVKAEGWIAMTAMLNVFPRVIYCKRLEREGEITYEARVELTNMATGVVVGAGEAMASNAEKKPWGRDEFSVKSMAQTRAVGKAARLSFSWIMALAGYEPCAAEEMDGVQPIRPVMPQAKPKVEAPTQQAEAPIEFSEPPAEYKQNPEKTISPKQQKMLFAVWMQAGFTKEDLKKHLQSAYGIEHTDKLTRKQFDEILALCEKEGKR